MTLALRYAAMSHVGLLRRGNEDSGYAGPRLLAVADGMGGHAAGEVASAIAISSLAALDEDAPGTDLLAALRSAAEDANAHLRAMVASDAALEGMGTTLTSLLFTGTRLGLLHIGDSRCYLLRDGTLTQITHDDTLVQSLVDEGRISADEASSHPQRNMILQALDGRDDLQFDLSVREAREGDRYLLCSDGLTGPVGHETLQEALLTPDLQAAAERLVELALRGGGPDNITVIVADVVDGEPSRAPLVAGAAADSPQPLPHLSSGAAGRAAAERAAAAPPPEPVPIVTAAPSSPRHLRRTAVLSVLVLGLLGAGVGTAYAYVHGQWYVGTDGDQVTVFRGLAGSVAGLDLSSVQERTDLPTGALSELDREDVERGIHATSPTDAKRIVTVLHDRAACTGPSATPTPVVSTVPTDLPGTLPPPEPGPTPTSDAGAPTPAPLDTATPTGRPATSAPSPSASAGAPGCGTVPLHVPSPSADPTGTPSPAAPSSPSASPESSPTPTPTGSGGPFSTAPAAGPSAATRTTPTSAPGPTGSEAAP